MTVSNEFDDVFEHLPIPVDHDGVIPSQPPLHVQIVFADIGQHAIWDFDQRGLAGHVEGAPNVEENVTRAVQYEIKLKKIDPNWKQKECKKQRGRA